MANTPSSEPTQFRAGDTVLWSKSLADYSPADSWVLKYKFVGSAGKSDDITATVSGDAWVVTVAKTVTAALAAGIYTLIGWVEKGTERYTVAETTVQILTNIAIASAATDTRSHARKTLALIEAAIESYAVRPVEQLSIAGRTWTRPSLETLNRLRSKYAKLVRREVEKERRAKGLPAKRILAQFPPIS